MQEEKNAFDDLVQSIKSKTSSSKSQTKKPTTASNPTKKQEPDAKCGSAKVITNEGAKTFFKSLGTFFKTMFDCLVLSFKGWANDGYSLSALGKNSRWAYMLVALIIVVFIIMIIIVLGVKAKENRQLTPKTTERFASSPSSSQPIIRRETIIEEVPGMSLGRQGFDTGNAYSG